MSKVLVLDVTWSDVEELAERGLLEEVDTFEGYSLYDLRQVDQIAAEQADVVAEIVASRERWIADSMRPWDARQLLGWERHEWDRVVRERGLRAGRFRRYARCDVEGLREDTTLTDDVRRARLVGPDQAAAICGIRRTDWNYLEVLGVVAAETWGKWEVRKGVWRRYPLYRRGVVEDLDQFPGIDWEGLRQVPAGARSPLLDLIAVLPPTRAAVIRQFVAVLATEHNVELWARYDGRRDRWEIDWAAPAGVEFSAQTVREAINGDKVVSQYREEIVVSPKAGAAVRRARAMVVPDAACILHTETTGREGAIVEVAVIDACSGATLLHTLVDPGEVNMEGTALRMHGITEAELAGAPRWPDVLPKVAAAADGKTILGYNADFSRGRIGFECERYGLVAGELARPDRWGCVMDERSDWARSSGWLPLGFRQRALGDVPRAREILVAMGQGPRR